MSKLLEEQDLGAAPSGPLAALTLSAAFCQERGDRRGLTLSGS